MAGPAFLWVALAFGLLTAYADQADGAEFANAALQLAIAALGLMTSLKAIVGLGWRHIVTIVGATIVLLVIVAGGLAVVPVG